MWYGLRVLHQNTSDKHGVRRSAAAVRPEDAPALTSRIQLADPETKSPNRLNAVPALYAAHGYSAPPKQGSGLSVELTARE